MGVLRGIANKLYESGALLGFAITSIDGEVVHNESFFSDEAAGKAMATMAGCVEQLAVSERKVKRLTIELDDVVVIFIHITDRDRYGMFIFTRSCSWNEVAVKLAELSA